MFFLRRIFLVLSLSFSSNQKRPHVLVDSKFSRANWKQGVPEGLLSSFYRPLKQKKFNPKHNSTGHFRCPDLDFPRGSSLPEVERKPGLTLECETADWVGCEPRPCPPRCYWFLLNECKCNSGNLIFAAWTGPPIQLSSQSKQDCPFMNLHHC